VKDGKWAGLRARVSSSGMLAGSAERAWQVFAGLSLVALSWWYFAAHRLPSPDGYHGLVASFGWIGTALAVLAAALSVRKRLAYQGVGKLSGWMRAHIYLGVLAAFAIFYHTGFHAGGWVTSLLMTFFLLTIASGLLGWWISRKVPTLLTAVEEKPAILEELLIIRADCLRGMLELAIAGTPEFRVAVKQHLTKETASWPRMLRFFRRRSTLAQELPAFLKEQEQAQTSLPESERGAFQRAAEYALQVNKMNAELLLQRVLRGWLTLHMVTTAAMFGLAAVHIFSVLYY